MALSFLTPEDIARLTELDLPVATGALLSEQALKKFSEDKLVEVLSGETDVKTLPVSRLLMDLDHLRHISDETQTRFNVTDYQIMQLKEVIGALLTMLIDEKNRNMTYDLEQIKDNLSRV